MLGISHVDKVLLALALAIVIVYAFGVWVGPVRKQIWFRRRTRFSFFGKRGPLGDTLHFGYPCTREGVGVTIAMVLTLSASSAFVWYVL